MVRCTLALTPDIVAMATAAYVAGCTIRGIAREFELNRTELRLELRRLGVLICLGPKNEGYRSDVRARVQQRYHRWSTEGRAKMVALYLAGESMGQISRMLGCDRKSVTRALKEAEVYRPHVFPVTCRLSQPPVESFLGVASDCAIARALNCSSSTVSRYRRKVGIQTAAPALMGRHRRYCLDTPRLFGGSRHEICADDSWSDWLEESGATVSYLRCRG